MPLTSEQRRDINRQNAKKSTGPKTEEGKAKARENAMKHGLRSKVLALPNEDPVKIAERAASWNDYYNPRSPAAQQLVNECVQATILSGRVHQYHHFALSSQIRGAKKAWERAREDEVKNLEPLLYQDPAEAVRLLKRSGHGVAFLIGRWEVLRKRFLADGCLTGSECDEAIVLLGCRSTLEDMHDHPGAYMMCLFNALANNAPAEAGLQALRDRKNVPPSLRRKIIGAPDRPPEECRTWIKNLFTQELAALNKLAETIEEIEFPDYAELEDGAMILHVEKDARLFLRYHAESRTAFHRAFNKLEKTLESDAARVSCVEELSPNEAKPQACPELESGPPNEADAQARDDLGPEMSPPNEANFAETVSEADAGLLEKRKPVVIGLMLLLLLFSAGIAMAAPSPNEANPRREVIAVDAADHVGFCPRDITEDVSGAVGWVATRYRRMSRNTKAYEFVGCVLQDAPIFGASRVRGKTRCVWKDAPYGKIPKSVRSRVSLLIQRRRAATRRTFCLEQHRSRGEPPQTSSRRSILTFPSAKGLVCPGILGRSMISSNFARR